MKRVFLVALVICSLSIPTYAQNAGASGAHVLTQMLSVYASCNSYSDEGNVEEIIITKDRTWTTNRPFTTAFVRPSFFYFEYQEQFQNQGKWKKYVAWEEAGVAHSWWSIDPIIRTKNSLRQALPVATSRLSAYNVPFLLREDIKRRGHRFQMISTFDLIGEETVNGQVAYKLTGYDQHPQIKDPIQPITIWVDKQSFLILKIYQKLKLQSSTTGEDFETDTTTIYKPKINIEIPLEKFKVTVSSE